MRQFSYQKKTNKQKEADANIAGGTQWQKH